MSEIEDVGPVRSIVQDGADSPPERLAPDKKSQRVEIPLERYLRVDRGKSGGRVDADSMHAGLLGIFIQHGSGETRKPIMGTRRHRRARTAATIRAVGSIAY